MKKLLNNLFSKGSKGALDILDTGLTLISDKTRDGGDSFTKDKEKKGKSISSKRVLNFTGAGSIVSIGLYNIVSVGMTWQNITLVAIGATYSYLMTRLTVEAEKPK